MIQATRWILVLMLLLLGVAAGVRSYRLFEVSSGLPEYTNAQRASELLAVVDPADDAARSQWSTEYWALQTDKWPLQHQAEGWAALATSLLIASGVGASIAARGGDLLATPRSTIPVRAALTIACLAQIPFAYWYFTRQAGSEHCCASWADSAAIPIGGAGVAAIVLLVVSALYFLPLITAKRLPATLGRPVRHTGPGLFLWPLYLVLPAVGFGLCIVGGLDELPSLVPLGVIGLWTTLVALAAALKPYQGAA